MVRRLVLAILLGVVITILIVVASARWSNPRGGVMTNRMLGTSGTETVLIDDLDGRTFRLRQVHFESPGLHARFRPLDREALGYDVPNSISERSSPWRGEWPRDPDGFADPSNFPRPPEGFVHDAPALHIAHGWPWLAAECQIWWLVKDVPAGSAAQSQVLHVHQGMLFGTASAQTPLLELRALPLRPLWLGFAANVTAFSTVFLILLGVADGCRQLRRYRRGLCPRCAYDRSHDYAKPCPECGHASVAPGRAATGYI
ncbi:MAG: hypothetical protein L6Q35_06470 [Phycisphaerales bacterium]|nr:hypothetical protein [Phycisphaerales bacterium]